jgi:hypothetical protein
MSSSPGPDDPQPSLDPERVRLLLGEIFGAAGRDDDDWETYDRVMVEERRTAVLIRPERTRATDERGRRRLTRNPLTTSLWRL